MTVDMNFGVNTTTDGEIMVSETEKESDVFSQYIAAYSADTYVILVSKDNVNFPHKLQGQSGTRIDVSSLHYAAVMAINADAQIRVGVITRIDGTNADIKYAIAVPLISGGALVKEPLVISLHASPSQAKLDFDANGVLQHGITNLVETNVVAVNTGITLASPAGNITPGLGDVIMKYAHTAGSATVGAFIFYHNTD